MVTNELVRDVHRSMRDHALAGRFTDAASLLPLLDGRSAEDLQSVDLADLWWMFAEQIADALAKTDPTSAKRLYDLARVSYEKEGSYATGAGEGMMAMQNVSRVKAKRASLGD